MIGWAVIVGALLVLAALGLAEVAHTALAPATNGALTMLAHPAIPLP